MEVVLPSGRTFYIGEGRVKVTENNTKAGQQADLRQIVKEIGQQVSQSFVANHRVLSFTEYLDLVKKAPERQLRSAPQYLLDAIHHFGQTEVRRPWGTTTRYGIFDCPWAEGRDSLVGQENVQSEIVRAIEGFVQEGTSNKLILLHGPNGSAKSTLVRCLGRGLQHYSTEENGALYRFNWIFPTYNTNNSGIGFSQSVAEIAAKDSYAYLEDSQIDAKLVDELRDHPLLLIPQDSRKILLDELRADPRMQQFTMSDYLSYGQLSPKNKAIYEALLTNYKGDFGRVLQHVQVERFYIEHRYRQGYVTIEPQLTVDATERQVTMDRSTSTLPASLHNVSLYEYGGELTAANRGLIEYSDLLKRPLQAYKYLLSTVEKASVPLPNASLFLDMVYMGTTNEIHLAAFKQVPEFQSFRGRLAMIRVPYLLDFTQEMKIYEEKIVEAAGDRHVAPHCTYVAALWSVLTRMRKPNKDHFSQNVRTVIADMTPLEKAELYALGKTPDRLGTESSKSLLSVLPEIWSEWENHSDYEGRTGVSPREIMQVIFHAATHRDYSYMSPLAILDEIDDLIANVSVYEFLRQDPKSGYLDHKSFVNIVRDSLTNRIDDEIRACLGLVDEAAYDDIFRKYINHVTHWTRKEKIYNEAKGISEEPDSQFMKEIEEVLATGKDAKDFRKDFIGRIGAWSLDHPKEDPDYTVIFADEYKRLHLAYYERQKQPVREGVQALLHYLSGGSALLSAEQKQIAQQALTAMIENYGYTQDSAKDAASLLRQRYE